MAITFDLVSNAVVNDGQTASFEVSNISGGTAPYTIEYYRNGLPDHTGNPWSFTADGSMDGDSIVAVVGSGVVLQYNFSNISPFVRDPAYADMTFSLVSATEIMWEQLSAQYAQYNSSEKNWIDAPFFFEFDFASVGNIGSSSVSWFDISAYNSSGVKITEVLQIVHEVGVNEVSIRFAGGQFLDIPFAYSAFFVRADYDGSEMTLSIFESNGGALIETRTVAGNFSGAVSVRQYVASVGCTTTVSNFATDMLVSDDTFEKSDPVIMSVLHYTAQPPSPQNLTEGDPLSLTWDFAGVNPVGSITEYTVNKNGVPVDSGSTTDTTISYLIPSVALSDAGEYDLTITNGGRDPFQSDIVVVNVASATSSHLPFAGYSVDISLGLSIQSGMRSNQVVYDYGLHADEYTSEIEYYSESESDFPTVAKNAPNDIKEEGFFPFAPHVTNSSLNGYRYPKFAGKYNFLGKYWKWDVEVIPYDVTEFEYAPQTWSCNSVTNFSFGNLANFIIPDISPISEFNVQYNRSGNVIREYERIKESSARKVKFKWTRLKNDEAAALLSYIITGVRSSQIPVDFGDMAISSPWVVRDGETGTIFNMRLSSNIIKVKHRSGNIWDVEIEMLKVEE